MQYMDLPIDQAVVIDGWNPRTHMDTSELEALEDSIRVEGILTPIIVVPATGGYAVVDGHRRLTAAKAAGLTIIPAIIRDNESEDLLAATVMNLRREQLRPVDEAETYRRLTVSGISDVDVAKALGRPVEHVRDRMRLLKLSDEIRRRVNTRDIPLTTVPVLEQIADASPGLADQVAAVITADDGKYSPQDLAGNMADVIHAADNKGDIAHKCPSWLQHNVVAKIQNQRIGELVRQIDDTGNGQTWWTIQLTEEDADAARAYGCYITDTQGSLKYGGLRGWIVDTAFYHDRIVQALEKKLTELQELAAEREAARTASSDTPQDISPEVQAAREERAKRDAEAEQRRTAAKIQNERLGAHLYTTLHEQLPGHIALDATKWVAIAAVTANDADTAAAVTDPTDGMTDYNHEKVVTASEALVKDILAATTIAAVISRTTAALIASVAADGHNVGAYLGLYASHREGDHIVELPHMRVVIDGILGTLPEQHATALDALKELDRDDAGDATDTEADEQEAA